MKKLLILLALCSPLYGQQILSPILFANSSGGGGVTLSYVGSGSNSCFTTTCAVTYSPTNGNLVKVDYFCYDTTASQNPTITTDNGSSTWSNAFIYTDAGNWYETEDYTLSSAGSPTTITVHCGAATNTIDVVVSEYHRTSGSWAFGGAATQAFGTSTTATGNSVTPTSSVPALISGWFLNKATNAAFTNGNTTIRVSVGDSYHGEEISAGDQIVSSASGSYSASAGLTVSNAWTAITSWFK